MDKDQIKSCLQSNGLRFTRQRYAVMAFLAEHNGHPTASETFEFLNDLYPELTSLATTYNNLRDLVNAGLLREVMAEGRAARYDAKRTKHHHFVCDRCGSIEDVQWYALLNPELPLSGKHVIRELEVTLRGQCPECSQISRGARR
jgi:Fur family peroxide stress response transcriptional regulator